MFAAAAFDAGRILGVDRDVENDDLEHVFG
jgi:hypothetical protein